MLRECIFTWDELSDLPKLMNELDAVASVIQKHIEVECIECDFIGEKCPFNCSKNPFDLRFWTYNVSTIARCMKCGISGHRKCLLAHKHWIIINFIIIYLKYKCRVTQVHQIQSWRMCQRFLLPPKFKNSHPLKLHLS